MNPKKQIEYAVLRIGAAAIMAATFLIIPIIVSAHGGKTHSGGIQFSHLQALQKATQMYDRLVTSGKLSEDWELGLKQVDISSRNIKTGKETVVSFTRFKGEPSTVFFFFQDDGKYAGSNFTGK
jgi:hypothetical protein